jgi:hypothetical protein
LYKIKRPGNADIMQASSRGASAMPKFAANLSMMFTEVPFLDRFGAAAQAGFRAVEFLFPYEHSPQAIADQLRLGRWRARHGLHPRS